MSEECSICYESMGNTNITTTACGHTFCFSREEEELSRRPKKLSLIHPDLLDSFEYIPFQDTPVPSSLRSSNRIVW